MKSTTTPIAHVVRPALVLALAATLAACGGAGEREAKQREAARGGEALPTPVGTRGVTGTPDVAPGGDAQTPSLGGTPPPAAPTEDLVIQEGMPPLNPETGVGIDPDGDGPLVAPPAVDTGAAEPTPADAVAVIRDYYAAVNARDYASAYRLWSGSGTASGQTNLQFAAGFERTQGVSVEVGAPGRQDAGAGQRYLQVPVSLRATQADGSVRRFAGSYVLHRSVVDGATPDQRAWRIRSADLREVTP